MPSHLPRRCCSAGTGKMHAFSACAVGTNVELVVTCPAASHGGASLVRMTPTEARHLAAILTEAAANADALAVQRVEALLG